MAVRYEGFQTNEDSHCNLLYCTLVGGSQTTKKMEWWHHPKCQSMVVYVTVSRKWLYLLLRTEW